MPILAALAARALLPAACRAALPLAFAAAIAVSMIVNDSPKEVAVAGAVLYLAVEALALGAAQRGGAPVDLPSRARAQAFPDPDTSE